MLFSVVRSALPIVELLVLWLKAYGIQNHADGVYNVATYSAFI